VTPAPMLEELINSVQADAASDEPLDLLSQAAQMAAGLEGTADALVGHFVDRSRISGHSWSQISGALGVSKQAVHKRFSVSAATFESDSPTFERFTPRAKEVLRGAAKNARRRGSASVAADDLLIALFEDAQSIAARVLARAGITRDACELALGRETADGEETGADRLPFGESATCVLKRSVEEALRLAHNYVGTEHLLLGLYYSPEDPAARTLIGLGAGYADIKTGIAKEFAELAKG
jgi:ATP-dependent Clp protease ATP-binding subunit ClpA